MSMYVILNNMKKQKWFKRVILERMYSETEMESFLEDYEKAKLYNLGKSGLLEGKRINRKEVK